VRDQQAAIESTLKLSGHVGESRRARHHVVGDSSECRDAERDRLARIDQRAPLVDVFAVDHLDQTDFGDAVAVGVGPGGLQVEKDDCGVEHISGYYVSAA
jgi:hypothetical protein